LERAPGGDDCHAASDPDPSRKFQAPNSKSQTNPKSKIPRLKTLAPRGRTGGGERGGSAQEVLRFLPFGSFAFVCDLEFGIWNFLAVRLFSQNFHPSITQPALSSPLLDKEGWMRYHAPQQGRAGGRHLIVVPCRAGAWQELLGRTERTLAWVPAAPCVPEGAHLPFSGRVPVLFWGAGREEAGKPRAIARSWVTWHNWVIAIPAAC